MHDSYYRIALKYWHATSKEEWRLLLKNLEGKIPPINIHVNREPRNNNNCGKRVSLQREIYGNESTAKRNGNYPPFPELTCNSYAHIHITADIIRRTENVP